MPAFQRAVIPGSQKGSTPRSLYETPDRVVLSRATRRRQEGLPEKSAAIAAYIQRRASAPLRLLSDASHASAVCRRSSRLATTTQGACQAAGYEGGIELGLLPFFNRSGSPSGLLQLSSPLLSVRFTVTAKLDVNLTTRDFLNIPKKRGGAIFRFLAVRDAWFRRSRFFSKNQVVFHTAKTVSRLRRR
jgi:hypothetical protein